MYSVCDDLKGRVSPFGNLRIKACLLAPRSLSQATTSFIACNRQGIRHVHLVTCPYNVASCRQDAVIVASTTYFITVFHEFYYYPKCEPFDSRLIKLYFFQIVKERYYVYQRLRSFVKTVGGG